MPPKPHLHENASPRQLAHPFVGATIASQRIPGAPATPTQGSGSWIPEPELVWMNEKICELAHNAEVAALAMGIVKTISMRLHSQRNDTECKRDRAKEKVDEAMALQRWNEAKSFLKEWGLQWDAVVGQPCERQAARPNVNTVEDLIRMKETEMKVCRDVINERFQQYSNAANDLKHAQAELTQTRQERDKWQTLANAREQKLQQLKAAETKSKRADERIRQLEGTLKDKDRSYEKLKQAHDAIQTENGVLALRAKNRDCSFDELKHSHEAERMLLAQRLEDAEKKLAALQEANAALSVGQSDLDGQEDDTGAASSSDEHALGLDTRDGEHVRKDG